jgi:hypothetical protein
MPNYLVIRNNTVENVLLADTQEIAELVAPEGTEVVESTGSEPWINWTLVNNTWTAPPVEEPVIITE